MRGERSTRPCVISALMGSSPHARGTLSGTELAPVPDRFIPACAGNARHPASIRSWTTVHPRMRGERGSVCCTALMFSGSSPHARGTHGCVPCAADLHRFIPACAGNANFGQIAEEGDTVHPRMRGERHTASDGLKTRSGSSPHARGTPKEVRDYAVNKRFIPACAGNAAWRTLPPHGPSVHPRMRGERAKGLFPGAAKTGSSPHARGTLRFGQPHACGQRFIPACAGNAHRERREREHHAVHPRMRGERARRGARRGVGRRFIPACAGNAHCRRKGISGCFGSSPHARGTPMKGPSQCVIWRFIPACAGNASWLSIGCRYTGGSSPHARGTRCLIELVHDNNRFIPACAGNARLCRARLPTWPVHPRMRGERASIRSRTRSGIGSSPHARGTHFQ